MILQFSTLNSGTQVCDWNVNGRSVSMLTARRMDRATGSGLDKHRMMLVPVLFAQTGEYCGSVSDGEMLLPSNTVV